MIDTLETKPDIGILLTPLEVQKLYEDAERSKNGKVTDYVLTLISHYPIWKHETWDAKKLAELKIFHEGKSLWTGGLTDNGQDLSIAYAAANYESNPDFFREANSDYANYIEDIIRKLHLGIIPKPAFVVPGSKYPNAPLSDFIDGTKSTLAVYIFQLRTGKNVDLEMLVGQKAPLWQRAAKKLLHP